MSDKTSTTDRTAMAASVAPEDVRCGDYVAVLNEIVELPSSLWCDSTTSTTDPVRVKFCALEGGTPLKVKAICLPFVCVKSPDKKVQTLDVRQVQLVRMEKRYSKTVWKELRRGNA